MPEMLHEEPSQMTRAKPESFRQLLHAPLVQSAFQYQSEASGNYSGSAEPGGRARGCLRLAPLAGAETRCLRRLRVRKQDKISRPRKLDRANVPAI